MYRSKCHDLAPMIAMVRSEASKSVYKKGTRYYRENESQVSLNGVISELIARDWLQREFKKGRIKELDLTPLIELDPVVGADGIVDNKSVDFKHKGKGNQNILGRVFINYNAHNNKKKKCDVYYFIENNPKIVDCDGDVGWCSGIIYEIPSELVDSWEYTEKWVDKCYFYDIQETDIIK